MRERPYDGGRLCGAIRYCATAAPALADRMLVTIGSLDEPGRARIDDHVWTKDRVPWFDTTDKLPRFPDHSSAVKTRAFD